MLDKIKNIGKIHKARFLLRELKKIHMTPDGAYKRIAVFNEEYLRQYTIINQKLKETKKLNHVKQHNRIMEYKQDLESIKSKLDTLILGLQNKNESKRVIERIKKSKIGVFTLIFREMVTVSRRYKKEDCDIDNFEV